MARFAYANPMDTPVRMELTVNELRRICDILQREVERGGPDRHFAKDLYAVLTEAIAKSGESMGLESNWIKNHMIQHLADKMNDAQEQANKLEA